MGLFDDSDDDITELPLFTRIKRKPNDSSETIGQHSQQISNSCEHLADKTELSAKLTTSEPLIDENKLSNHTLTLDSDDDAEEDKTLTNALNDSLEPISNIRKSMASEPITDSSESVSCSSEKIINSYEPTTSRELDMNYPNNLSNETLTLDSDSKDSDSNQLLNTKDVSNDSIEVVYCSPTNQNKGPNDSIPTQPKNSCDHSFRSTVSDWTPIKAKFISRTPTLQKIVQKKTKVSVKKSIDILNNRGRKEKPTQVEKALQKERDRVNKEVLMSRALKNSTKYCFAVIDRKLYELIKESLDHLFAEKECNFRVTDSPSYEMCVTWIRKHLEVVDSDCQSTDSPKSIQSSQSSIATTEVSEQHMILVMDVTDFIARVNAYVIKSGQTLFDLIQDVTKRTIVKNVVLVVPKLDNYFKRQKSKEDKLYRQRLKELDSDTQTFSQNPRRQRRESMPSITREDMDLALIDMEVRIESQLRVALIKVNDYSEVSKVVYRYTRAVAESSARKEKNSDFSWYVEADNRNCVDPIDEASRLKLWKHQLMQFPKVSYHIANAIATQYPTPKSLLEAYSRQSNPELILADVIVTRRQLSGSTTERKVGPELSQRIHRFMTSTDPQKLLDR